MTRADNGIGLVIPTIWPRRTRLARALASVGSQTLLPVDVIVQDDAVGVGAAITRDAGLRRVRTPWVAFLDDDDWLYPDHLETLLTAALSDGADYVWSWYDLRYPGLAEPQNQNDPLPHFGKQWDPDNQTQTTIVTLVRTEIAQAVGFLHGDATDQTVHGQRVGEDFLFTVGCAAAGARMLHVPRRTWSWLHHEANLSGRPWRSAEMFPIAMADPTVTPGAVP